MLKTWELTRRCHLFDSKGHGDAVLAVAFSPDGQRIATGSADATARIWQARHGVYERTLAGHEVGVDGISFNKDGGMLATRCSGRSRVAGPSRVADFGVGIWNVEQGSCVTSLGQHDQPVWGFCFSPDGRLFASGDRSGRLIVWKIPSGEILWEASEHSGTIMNLSFSPDGRLVVSASFDATLRAWDVCSGNCVAVKPMRWGVKCATAGTTMISVSDGGRKEGLSESSSHFDATSLCDVASSAQTPCCRVCRFSSDVVRVARGLEVPRDTRFLRG